MRRSARALILGSCVFATSVSAQDDARRVVLLEPDSDRAGAALPLVRVIPPSDPRWSQVRGYMDNEAARFALRLLAAAWREGGDGLRVPPLAILLARGGNDARQGYRLQTSAGVETHEREPYIVLDLQPNRFRLTLLHEVGHIAHLVVRGLAPHEPHWTAAPHSTFAVTDPVTALAEGYAIHLETLWAHYGADSVQHALQFRTSPDFEAPGTAAPFYFPANDLLNFSQSWARYSAIRDGLAAFEGIAVNGSFQRALYDPARDRSTLRQPNAMVAAEGVVASALFWTVAGWSPSAKPGGGLDQAQILDAERTLLRALRAGPRGEQFRPDVIDVVGAAGAPGSRERAIGLTRFISITRGVTARSSLRQTWRSFYEAAMTVDQDASLAALKPLETARADLLRLAEKDPTSLRAALGPVVPVRVKGAQLQLRGLGQTGPLEFDLNGLSDAALLAMTGLSSAQRQSITRALAEQPFTSLQDLMSRTGIPADSLGLEEVAMRARE